MLVGKPYAMSGYAVAFPKGQTELKEEMDDLILELQDDGEWDWVIVDISLLDDINMDWMDRSILRRIDRIPTV